MSRLARAARVAAVVAVSALVAAGCSPSSGTGSVGIGPERTGSADEAPAARTAAGGSATTPTTAASTTSAPASTTTIPPDPVAVVVRSGGLDDAFIELIGAVDGVERLAVLRSGQVRMTASDDVAGRPVDRPPPGFVIQLEARAYDDPDAIEPFSPDLAAVLRRLGPDELLLSESSAALRRLDVGGEIEFDTGARLRVGAVLPDAIVGSTEVILAGADGLVAAGAPDDARRVALVDFAGTGAELEAELLAANGGEGVRVFGGRGGDAALDRQRSTLSQIAVKQTFGEFAFRPSGSSIEIDPAWVDANIVIVDLPLLGRTRCHRVFAETLAGVLQGLIDDGLVDLIEPSAFQGCWNPRTIAGSRRLSKHAWGIAADINFGNPLDGEPGSPVHPELLDRMDRAGFVSGHLWTTPDPGHFEYRRPPGEGE